MARRARLLLITEPAEAARLGELARGSRGEALTIRTLADLTEGQPPALQLRREQPSLLCLGMGQLGVDVAAYIQAAQRHHPDCAICLVCDPALAENVKRLSFDHLLLRPVRDKEWLAVLADALPLEASGPSVIVDQSLYDPPLRRAASVPHQIGAEPTMPLEDADLLPADAPRRGSHMPQPDESALSTRPILQSPPVMSARQDEPRFILSQELLRADDLLPDPMALFLNEPALHGQRTGPRHKSSRSGEIGQKDLPPPSRPAPPPAPGTEAGTGTKVAIDPSLYEDALGGIDVNSLGIEPVPVPVPMPPPLPPPPLPAPVLSVPPLPPPPVTLDSEGLLQATDPPTLTGRLCVTGYTGCLLLSRDGSEVAQRALYFDRGELCAASSSLVVDSLPELLYSEGRLSREQLKRARQVVESMRPPAEGSHRVAERLAEEQLLPRSEVAAILRRQVIEIFYRCFAWDQGHYRLVSRSPHKDDRVKLRETPKLLLLEGLRRKASLESLLSRVGPESTVLSPVGAGSLLLKEAGVTSAEQRALPFFDGHHTLAQVSAQSGLAEHATYVLAYALMCLGGLRRPPARGPDQGPSQRALGKTQPPKLPQGQAHSGERTPRRSTAVPISHQQLPSVDLARLRSKHRQVEEGDYFALLDLSPAAGPVEIRRAHEGLRAEFTPAAAGDPAAGLSPELTQELREIVLTLDEAYAVLSDDAVRAAYRAHLLPLPESGKTARSK